MEASLIVLRRRSRARRYNSCRHPPKNYDIAEDNGDCRKQWSRGPTRHFREPGLIGSKGSDQIAAEIQHKDPWLADARAIGAVLAVENDVVPSIGHTCCSSVWSLPSRHQ